MLGAGVGGEGAGSSAVDCALPLTPATPELQYSQEQPSSLVGN